MHKVILPIGVLLAMSACGQRHPHHAISLFPKPSADEVNLVAIGWVYQQNDVNYLEWILGKHDIELALESGLIVDLYVYENDALNAIEILRANEAQITTALGQNWGEFYINPKQP